jgi:indolepyruvate ferredoxin oxidoreductase
MTHVARAVTLDDKYELETGTAYMTGIQALVRLPLDRIRLDRAKGWHTAGFISGYRGSPLAGYDQQLIQAKKTLAAHDVVFQPGINEELGATAVWGSQKTGLHGAGSRFEGVFGLWYGKAPGVDRCGDVFKHGNQSGTADKGGVLAIAGDDHLAKSSTLACQSEHAFIDAEMPVFNPADLQDVLDYGLHALEASRFAGVWTALIALADTMDSSGIVDVSRDRLQFVRPRDESDPRLVASINKPMLLKTRLDNEMLLREVRLPAAQAYVRANGLDRIRFGALVRPRIGIVATGKAYRDLCQALELLGLTEARARELGVAVYKVAMPWPLEPMAMSSFARGLDRLLVVEHKRSVMEGQIKELMFHWPAYQRPTVWGKSTPEGTPFLSSIRELGAADIVPALLAFLPEIAEDQAMRAVADRLVQQAMWAAGNASDAKRSPFFCSGCPHNTSTKTPEGARSLAGIGCHAMTELAERTTDGLSAMGGEGVAWVGQFAFSNDQHVFANLGDGTYFHSGSLAIRQAVAAKAPITYKILYNDAVAMTGGQRLDGQMTVAQLTWQLHAEGVEKIVVVSERPQLYGRSAGLAPFVPVVPREEVITVQDELSRHRGVSVMIYDQTCAAEKRRRRKKKTYEDPNRRLFINDRVCEGCGDCSVQSNCLSVEPKDTAFGQKRKINQSSCNKDFSCVKGFCPSFVWVEGAGLKTASTSVDFVAMAQKIALPTIEPLTATRNLLIAGIGGTGITTVAAVLAMAAHVDGVNTLTLDMTGLAQKGGPVTSHVRFAPKAMAIQGPRIPAASLDVLIAADMLVGAGAETLAVMNPERTVTVANGRVAPTAEFVLRQTQSFEAAKLAKTLREASRDSLFTDAAGTAEALLGDALYANMMLVGAAWQMGHLPLSFEAIETAIRLNGAAVSKNLQAFACGRLAAAAPFELDALRPKSSAPKPMALAERIAFLEGELTAYQDAAYAATFRAAIDPVVAADTTADKRLARAVVDNVYKAMAIKDEYEVARLYADPAFKAKLAEEFEEGAKLKVMLSPPLLARLDPATGRPRKMAFGPWVFTLFDWMHKAKRVRGTALDVFGYTHERKMERALRDRALTDAALIAKRLAQGVDTATYQRLIDLARIPDEIRGFGPVKAEKAKAADAKRTRLLAELAQASAAPVARPVAVAAE